MKKYLLLLLLPLQLHALQVTAIVPEYDILQDLNKYRAKYNLQPVKKDERLCKLATIRARQIQTDWSHDGFQPEIDKIQGMSGVFYENLARNFAPNDVVWGWSMSNMGHREAMLVPDVTRGCIIKVKNFYAYEGYRE